MTVTSSRLVELFRTLESGEASREAIADYAREALKYDDTGALHFHPVIDADRIMSALIYLTGVDLRDAPDSYLHIVDDFREFRKKIGLEL